MKTKKYLFLLAVLLVMKGISYWAVIIIEKEQKNIEQWLHIAHEKGIKDLRPIMYQTLHLSKRTIETSTFIKGVRDNMMKMEGVDYNKRLVDLSTHIVQAQQQGIIGGDINEILCWDMPVALKHLALVEFILLRFLEENKDVFKRENNYVMIVDKVEERRDSLGIYLSFYNEWIGDNMEKIVINGKEVEERKFPLFFSERIESASVFIKNSITTEIKNYDYAKE